MSDKMSITTRNKLQYLSNIIGKFETQLHEQLSHSNRMKSYLKQLLSSTNIQYKENIIKMQSERYALYEYIHSIKHQNDTVPFNISNLQKEMEVDHIFDQQNGENINIIKKLELKNESLKLTLQSMCFLFFLIF